MAGTSRQNATVSLGAGSKPFSKLARKIVLLAGEDRFVLANCRSLLAVLSELAREVVVVTRLSGRPGDLEELGARTIDFDCRASLSNPAHDALTAWKLARILEAEDADALHFVGVRPAVLGGLALKLVVGRHVVVHLPDLDALEVATGACPGCIGPARKAHCIAAAPARIVPARGKCRRPCISACARRRAERALRRARRHRHRSRRLPGPAAIAERDAGRGLCQPHVGLERDRRADAGLRPRVGAGRASAAGAGRRAPVGRGRCHRARRDRAMGICIPAYGAPCP